VIVHSPEVVVGKWCEGAVERQQLEPVLGEVELANYLRTKKAYDVGGDAELEAREHFFGYGRAAQYVPPFAYEHVPARARKVRRTRQAVVTASYYYCVVALLHELLRQRAFILELEP
jgi:hypothetical protein